MLRSRERNGNVKASPLQLNISFEERLTLLFTPSRLNQLQKKNSLRWMRWVTNICLSIVAKNVLAIQ